MHGAEAGRASVVLAADAKGRDKSRAESTCEHIVQHRETGWDVANMHGVSLENLRKANRDSNVSLESLAEGDAVRLPPECLAHSAPPADAVILCLSGLKVSSSGHHSSASLPVRAIGSPAHTCASCMAAVAAKT